MKLMTSPVEIRAAADYSEGREVFWLAEQHLPGPVSRDRFDLHSPNRATRLRGGRSRVGEIPVERLSRYSRSLRPDRLGRHVRTCRRRLLRNLFQAMRRHPQRRRCHGAALDRPIHRACVVPGCWCGSTTSADPRAGATSSRRASAARALRRLDAVTTNLTDIAWRSVGLPVV